MAELVWRRHDAYASERSLTKFIEYTHHPATANYFVDRKLHKIYTPIKQQVWTELDACVNAHN